MNKRWCETFALWSQSEEFRDKVEKAKKEIEKVIKNFNKPYCAFSGGKDSLVMTHLVHILKPDIDVITLDYSRNFVPLRYIIETKKIAKELGWNHKVIRSRILENEKNDGRPIMMRVINIEIAPYLLRKGYDVAFIGIRKEESPWREFRIQNKTNLSRIPEFYPVADFTWMDIWAYIISYQLPYLSIYDKYGQVVGWDSVRFSTLFDQEHETIGAPNIDGYFSYRYRYPKK